MLPLSLKGCRGEAYAVGSQRLGASTPVVPEAWSQVTEKAAVQLRTVTLQNALVSARVASSAPKAVK